MNKHQIRKKFRYLYTIIFFATQLLLSCSTEEKKQVTQKPRVITSSKKAFFTYDDILYYRVSATFKDYAFMTGEKQTPMGRLGYLPLSKGINDTLLYKDLKELNIKPEHIDSGFFEELNTKIFAEKECDPMWAAVQPIYRDILVFKNKGKISGLVKVSFHTGTAEIEGSNYNTECFNQFGEIHLLKNILKPDLRLN